MCFSHKQKENFPKKREALYDVCSHMIQNGRLYSMLETKWTGGGALSKVCVSDEI